MMSSEEGVEDFVTTEYISLHTKKRDHGEGVKKMRVVIYGRPLSTLIPV